MSRRTKLIITALFLVLLAIPVAYTVLSWRPEQPLRFRFMELQGPPRPVYSGPSSSLGPPRVPIGLAVENVSAVPIHTYSLLNSDDTFSFGVSSIHAFSFTRKYAGAVRKHSVIIPPHSTLYLSQGWQLRSLASAKQGTLQIVYMWNSHTQCLFARACDWTHDHCPSFLQSFVPDLKIDCGEAPLQPPHDQQ